MLTKRLCRIQNVEYMRFGFRIALLNAVVPKIELFKIRLSEAMGDFRSSSKSRSNMRISTLVSQRKQNINKHVYFGDRHDEVGSPFCDLKENKPVSMSASKSLNLGLI
ncbi:hypothetical protein L596_026521 [Steinernema carpocapsae]|uniref:Uncharacterized protein n=1 Tax=Steinernema carpocapsae TaxID=34508 RepID=A0A4U5M1P2_STECR|nr:hypothetical protein L596_026521 [Steinernema carpocapsae]